MEFVKNLNVVDFVCAAALFVGLLVIIPITVTTLINYIRILRLTRGKFFQSRQPSLGILLFERPLLAFYNVFSFSSNIKFVDMYRWIFELIHGLLWFALLTAFCIKFYLLYFNQQLNLAVINQTWQKQINIGVTGMFNISIYIYMYV